MKRNTILIVLSLAVTSPLGAQIRVPIEDGARVRITGPRLPAPLFGSVSLRPSDTLVVTTRDEAARIIMTRAAATSIDVSRGRDRLRAAAAGAGIGLLAGGVLGAYLLPANETDGFATLVGVVAGAATGLTTGALTGAAFATERWRTVHSAVPTNDVVSVTVRDGARVQRYADGTIAVIGEKDRKRGVVRGALVFAGFTMIVGGIDLAGDKISGSDYIGAVAGNAVVGGVVGYFIAPRGRQRLPAP